MNNHIFIFCKSSIDRITPNILLYLFVLQSGDRHCAQHEVFYKRARQGPIELEPCPSFSKPQRQRNGNVDKRKV